MHRNDAWTGAEMIQIPQYPSFGGHDTEAVMAQLMRMGMATRDMKQK